MVSSKRRALGDCFGYLHHFREEYYIWCLDRLSDYMRGGLWAHRPNDLATASVYRYSSDARQPLIAVQAVLPLSQVPVGSTIILFFQFFGGSIFLAIAQNIFRTRLLAKLVTDAPTEDAHAVLRAGAEGVRQIVVAKNSSSVLDAYNIAITDTFVSCNESTSALFAHWHRWQSQFIGAAASVVTLFFVGEMEWASTKDESLRLQREDNEPVAS